MLGVGSVIRLSERKTQLRANAPLTLNGRNNAGLEGKVAVKLRTKGGQSKQIAQHSKYKD